VLSICVVFCFMFRARVVGWDGKLVLVGKSSCFKVRVCISRILVCRLAFHLYSFQDLGLGM
jgi:hypothetical protein